MRCRVYTHCGTIQFCLGLSSASLGGLTGLALGKPQHRWLLTSLGKISQNIEIEHYVEIKSKSQLLNCFHGEPLSTEKQRLNGSGSATPRLNGLNLNSQSTNLVINGIFTCSCRIFFNKTRGRGKLILNLFLEIGGLLCFSHIALSSQALCPMETAPFPYSIQICIGASQKYQQTMLSKPPIPHPHDIRLCYVQMEEVECSFP